MIIIKWAHGTIIYMEAEKNKMLFAIGIISIVNISNKICEEIHSYNNEYKTY